MVVAASPDEMVIEDHGCRTGGFSLCSATMLIEAVSASEVAGG